MEDLRVGLDKDPIPVVAMKRPAIAGGFARDIAGNSRLDRTRDYAEGLEAWLEKRTPNFIGQ